MSTCILVACYLGHLHDLRRFLYSYWRLGVRHVPVYVMVSRHEAGAFRQAGVGTARAPLVPLDVRLLVMSDVIHGIDGGTRVDEDELLAAQGKCNFQSLKKLYGLMHLVEVGHTEVMVLDSECVVVRELDVGDVVGRYLRDPYVICNSYVFDRPEMLQAYSWDHQEVMRSSHALIGVDAVAAGLGFMLEYYMWVFDVERVRAFVDRLKAVGGQGTMCEALAVHRIVFIEVAYFAHQVLSGRARAIHAHPALTEAGLSDADVHEMHARALPFAAIEDMCITVEDGGVASVAALHRLIDQLGLPLYKPLDTARSLAFVQAAPSVKVCVSKSAPHIFAAFHDAADFQARVGLAEGASRDRPSWSRHCMHLCRQGGVLAALPFTILETPQPERSRSTHGPRMRAPGSR